MGSVETYSLESTHRGLENVGAGIEMYPKRHELLYIPTSLSPRHSYHYSSVLSSSPSAHRELKPATNWMLYGTYIMASLQTGVESSGFLLPFFLFVPWVSISSEFLQRDKWLAEERRTGAAIDPTASRFLYNQLSCQLKSCSYVFVACYMDYVVVFYDGIWQLAGILYLFKNWWKTNSQVARQWLENGTKTYLTWTWNFVHLITCSFSPGLNKLVTI